MRFHEKIKPHHHVTVWAVAALVVAFSASTYTGSSFAQNHPGPNEKTRSFFGDEGEHGDSGREELPECSFGGMNRGDYTPGAHSTKY